MFLGNNFNLLMTYLNKSNNYNYLHKKIRYTQRNKYSQKYWSGVCYDAEYSH